MITSNQSFLPVGFVGLVSIAIVELVECDENMLEEVVTEGDGCRVATITAFDDDDDDDDDSNSGDDNIDDNNDDDISVDVDVNGAVISEADK